MGAQFSQFFPPRPAFTEADVASQEGRVFLITGGASGIGYELAQMLYRKHARVYIAGRSQQSAQRAIERIEAAAPPPSSRGSLAFLALDLADLSTIKASVDAFRAREAKLDVLWNNAGVSQPPPGSVSAQGFELQLATNCLGPFLLTQLLLPLLAAAAAEDAGSPPGSARVVWTASQMVELSAPPQGLRMAEVRAPPRDRARAYVNSKTGNLFLAAELARRAAGSVVSVSLNPGAAATNLFRHTPWLRYLAYPLLHAPALAAHTQLYAGLSPDVTTAANGGYVVPWGRIHDALRPDLREAMRPVADGGTGRAAEFWDFCAEKTRDYS
ncbi:NAD(P)-binding protein [Durotheca rogersii]|uniref:NAD(P)-binding protein n=1 Tax=Durotheca rogersii TaxID=419775 RepID=UPI00221E4FC4|nr:NAD(P)-binding protein [Durotheca rogersii]KAI5866413.1 NAD(P)-binding protein [Durotheca rogersii]